MRHHNLQVTGSVSVNGISAATAADLAVYTGSNDTKVSTLQSFTASVIETNTFTASANSRFDSIENFTASVNTTNTFTASATLRLNDLETKSASVDDTNISQTNRLNSLEEKTGSLATTGSNTFYGTQTFSGSVYVKENLIVQGSSSLQNITASAVDIGTNRIILNVDNPSVRYAGISVYDSGSTAGTGSLWWDSVENHWLYEHPSDSAAPYNSAILISGPKNAGNLGEELELVNNYIVKAVGGDHISSSAIYDDGSIVAIKNTTHITGSLNIGATAYPSVNLYTTNGTNFAITNRYTDNRLSIDRIGTGELVNILGSGAVGIGVTNPQRKVDIVATGEQLRLSYDGSTTYTDFRNDSAGGLLVNTSAGYIIHYIAGSPIMRMNANGNVGIGITNPSEKLQVSGSISSVKGATDGGQIQLSNSGGGSLWYWAARTTGLNLGELGAADGRMFIANGGNVGIGITNPSTTLDIRGTGEGIYVARIATADYGGHVRIQKARGSVASPTIVSNGDTLGSLTFEPYNGSLYTEQVGIRAVVNGTVSVGSIPTDLLFSAGASGNTGANEKMRIASSGNVGIGITNPSYPLHVNGNVYANRYIGAITETGSGDGNAPFRFAADYSGWMSHAAGTPGANDGWGIFWAGNGGAQYGTNGAGGPGNIWSNSTNPNEIAFVGGGNTMMSVHGNTGNVWIKGETRIASQLRVNGGTSTAPAAVFTSGGSSWSEGVWVNPAPNNYGGIYFLTAADTPGDGMWFTGKVSNTVSGWEHAYGIFRRGYTSPIGGGTATFAIKQDGTAYFNENVINTRANKAITFVQLNSTNFATKNFTYTGNPTGNFAVTDFSGIPSNAKAVQVVGWYHITGYSAGSGQGDHAMSWFGPATINNTTQWGGAGAGWPNGEGSYTPRFHGTFVMEHDGDASIQTGNSGAMHYYGSWHTGTINVHTDGNIYYSLGAGYSGGTHYNALVATGYWI
jgi:hypothetical protein